MKNVLWEFVRDTMICTALLSISLGIILMGIIDSVVLDTRSSFAIATAICCLISLALIRSVKKDELPRDDKKLIADMNGLTLALIVLTGIILLPFIWNTEIIAVKTEEVSVSPAVGYGEDGTSKVTYAVIKRLLGGKIVAKEPIREEIIIEPKNAKALCKDDTPSYSTGQGTCSHHGGVKAWL